MREKIKIGTRASKLAMVQTEIVCNALRTAHPHLQDADAIEIVKITTTGDRILDRSLMDAGGKGLFTKEIEEALYDGRVDMAVHSMKDMPTILPTGLEIPCILAREDARDAFFSPIASCLGDLPIGATVGTASLRRQAMVLAARPDLKVEVFRGNVQSRLQKLQDGVVDATLLAVAGLNRLDMLDAAQSVLSIEQFLPAVGQGAVGVEIRSDDTETAALLAALHCPETALSLAAERAFLDVMDGSCRTPIAGYAVFENAATCYLRTWVASPDGMDVHQHEARAEITTMQQADKFGREVGQALRAKCPEGFVYMPTAG